MRHFHASQGLKLSVPNEIVPIEHYLKQPRRLVQAITDTSRVQQMSETVFRLRLRPLKFMSLHVEPTADLKVWMADKGVLYLQALDCHLQGVKVPQNAFDLKLRGYLEPIRQGKTTMLRGEADLSVKVELPASIDFLPQSVLEPAGKALLNGVLLTIKHRLEGHLLDDYRVWAQDSEIPTSPTRLTKNSSLAQ